MNLIPIIFLINNFVIFYSLLFIIIVSTIYVNTHAGENFIRFILKFGSKKLYANP